KFLEEQQLAHGEEKPVTPTSASSAPQWLISDVFFGWATSTAESIGIRNFTFTTCGAYGSLGYISLWMNLPHRKQRIVDSDGPDGEENFSIPGFPKHCRFTMSQLPQIFRDADGKDPWSEFSGRRLRGRWSPSDGCATRWRNSWVRVTILFYFLFFMVNELEIKIY
ncbi:unnamed protein product, partial [Linum tenue]